MRKAEQSERTRRALIDAAIALFGERGYRATSLKAIAEAAGITHGVIPFHFGSKEGLLLAVVERCFDEFQRAVLGPLGERERDYGLGDLRAVMDALARFADEHSDIGRLFMVLMFEAFGPSPELQGHFRALHARLHALGCEWVRAGAERGSLRADLDPDAAVDAMLGFFTGVRAHSLLLGSPTSLRRVHGAMLTILRAGIEPENEGGPNDRADLSSTPRRGARPNRSRRR